MDLKNPRQNSANFSHNNDCVDLSIKNVKKKKIFKILGAASLALITCATTLLATAPFGASAASAAAENEITSQEKLAAGTLNLNPDTDPTIYTTSSGLEIKYANTIITPGDTISGLDGGQASSPSGINGYAYFKLGKYHWIIIGYNTSSTSTTISHSVQKMLWSDYLSNPTSLNQNNFAQGGLDLTTPAGTAISSHASKEIISLATLSFVLNYSSAVKNTTELDSGEFLVISKDILSNAQFSSSGSANYNGSTLHSVINNYYSTNCGFSTSEKALIIPQTIKTLWGTTSSTISDAYLFPLANRDASQEQFHYSTYLKTNDVRIAYSLGTNTAGSWLLRSGENISSNIYVYGVGPEGVVGNRGGVYAWPTVSSGVRPAMVVKLV